MKILFLTLAYPEGEDASNLYVDLMREFNQQGHDVYVATSLERRQKRNTFLSTQQGINVLRIQTGNIQKTNFIEKGISTLRLESQFCSAIKKYFNDVKFDLVIYSTPPITFAKVIKMIKKRDDAISYLLLKDIFPQNAVDMGLFKEKSLFNVFFRNKEINLYKNSDFIGCMSLKNKTYLLEHNSFLNEQKIEVCPNSISPKHIRPLSNHEKQEVKQRLNIPNEATVLIYGGNLGKPQGIDFLIEVLKEHQYREDIFYLIIGSGTEYEKLNQFIKTEKLNNCLLYSALPKREYEQYLKIADIGLILLDYRFTIPNFPSRLLNYMEFSIPVLAAVDENTDVGDYLKDGNFGYSCVSNDLKQYTEVLNQMISSKEELVKMGYNARQYLEEHYTVEKGVDIILSQIKK